MAVVQKWYLKPISIPLRKSPLDPRLVQLGAAALLSQRPRSLEVFWDGSEFELCFGSSSASDLSHLMELYRQRIRIEAFDKSDALSFAKSSDGSSYPIPKWLPRLDPSKTKFFFVGNQHGHCFVVFDCRKTGMLMDPLLATLKRCRLAWVQIEWLEVLMQGRLGDLRSTVTKRHEIIDRPIEEVRTSHDGSGRPFKWVDKHDHPDKGGEFHSSYWRLLSHTEGKMGSRLASVMVRGLVDPGMEDVFELPFSMIEDSGEVKYRREFRFWDITTTVGESKVGERLKEWWSRDPRMLLDLVHRRVFDTDHLLEAYVSRYLLRRQSLPFLILGSDELGLLIHPPSSNISGLKISRRSPLPPPRTTRTEKAGIVVAG